MSSETSQPGKVFSSSDRWLVLVLVSLDYFVLYLHRSVLGFIQKPLSGDLAISSADLGWLSPAFYIPYAFSQLFVGYLGDRIPRRRVILVSLTGSLVTLSLMSMVTDYYQLVALRILLGISQAASVPAIASVMADCFTPKNRSTAISLYLFSYNAAIYVAGKWGGKIADISAWNLTPSLAVEGWRMAFALFAAVGLIVCLILLFFLREPPRTERQEQRGLGTEGAAFLPTIIAVIRLPSFIMLAAAFVMSCVVINIKEFWLSRYFIERFDMNMETAGEFATLWIQGGTLIGLLVGGVLADAWARRAMGGRSAVQVIGFVLCAPSLCAIGLGDTQDVLSIAMLIFGMGIGLYTANLWTTTFEVVDPAARSTAIGLLNVAGGVASLAVPAVGRYFDEIMDTANQGTASSASELGYAFVVVGGVAALGAGLLLCHIKFFLPRDYQGPLKKS